MIDHRLIPLLSGKPLVEFTAAAFKEYVKGLYFKRVPRKAAPKIKILVPYKATLTKKSNLSVSVRRKPKWLSEAELSEISVSTGKPLNEVFLHCKKKEIKISTQAEEDRIAGDLNDMPW